VSGEKVGLCAFFQSATVSVRGVDSAQQAQNRSGTEQTVVAKSRREATRLTEAKEELHGVVQPQRPPLERRLTARGICAANPRAN
jgi:hypothetical protein